MNNFPAVIFDWDGTIMDSTPRIVAAMQAAAEKSALKVPAERQVRQIIGLSLSNAFDILFGELDSETHDYLFREYRYQYIEGVDIPTPLFEGAENTLNWLHLNDVKLAVATGKARHGLERVWRINDVHKLFHDSICADEAESKPHPQMLHELLSRNKWHSDFSIMIGDTSHDLLMAKQAGLPAIAVTFGAHDSDELEQYEPISLVNSYAELDEALQSWLNRVKG